MTQPESTGSSSGSAVGSPGSLASLPSPLAPPSQPNPARATGMPLSDEVDLRVKAYMSELVESHLPRIVAAAVAAHNSDVGAHGVQIKQAIDRLRLPLIGFILGTGVGGGMLLAKLLAFV